MSTSNPISASRVPRWAFNSKIRFLTTPNPMAIRNSRDDWKYNPSTMPAVEKVNRSAVGLSSVLYGLQGMVSRRGCAAVVEPDQFPVDRKSIPYVLPVYTVSYVQQVKGWGESMPVFETPGGPVGANRHIIGLNLSNNGTIYGATFPND